MTLLLYVYYKRHETVLLGSASDVRCFILQLVNVTAFHTLPFVVG